MSSCSPFKAKFILFNRILKNRIYIKAQEQIFHREPDLNILNNIGWKKKGPIQENANGKNLKEGHITRNPSIFIDHYSTFCALNCMEDKLLLGQRGFDTFLLLRRRKADNHTY